MIAHMHADSTQQQPPIVVAVVAYKGGVGKSLLAYELAYLLGAVLIDADHDAGGVTRQWGYRAEDRLRAPLLDALDSGKPPRPLTGVRKPDLVPSHPDLAANEPAAALFADRLESWAAHWGRPIVVDTHPGGNATTFGALAAARCVVSPVVLATRELEATDGMVRELPDYPLLLIPNKVPSSPPAAEIERLARIAKGAGIPVGPVVSHHGWLPTRKVRVAITSYGEQESKRVSKLAAELRAVAEAVTRHVA